MCGDECESVVHVLSECPDYKDKRERFMVKFRAILGEALKDFEAFDNIEKASFVLGCELLDGCSACFSSEVVLL